MSKSNKGPIHGVSFDQTVIDEVTTIEGEWANLTGWLTNSQVAEYMQRADLPSMPDLVIKYPDGDHPYRHLFHGLDITIINRRRADV